MNHLNRSIKKNLLKYFKLFIINVIKNISNLYGLKRNNLLHNT